MSITHRILVTCIVGIASIMLAACGAPSGHIFQTTVAVTVQSTSQTEPVVTVVAAQTACEPQALKQYAMAIDAQLRVFTQQATLVGVTPRDGIGVPLQRLLDIQTELHKLVPPACLSTYHERVVNMMQLYQLAYQNVAGQGNETVTNNLLMLATTELGAVCNDLQQIRAGTVPPTVAPSSTPTPSPFSRSWVRFLGLGDLG